MFVLFKLFLLWRKSVQMRDKVLVGNLLVTRGIELGHDGFHRRGQILCPLDLVVVRLRRTELLGTGRQLLLGLLLLLLTHLFRDTCQRLIGWTKNKHKCKQVKQMFFRIQMKNLPEDRKCSRNGSDHPHKALDTASHCHRTVHWRRMQVRHNPIHTGGHRQCSLSIHIVWNLPLFACNSSIPSWSTGDTHHIVKCVSWQTIIMIVINDQNNLPDMPWAELYRRLHPLCRSQYSPPTVCKTISFYLFQ